MSNASNDFKFAPVDAVRARRFNSWSEHRVFVPGDSSRRRTGHESHASSAPGSRSSSVFKSLASVPSSGIIAPSASSSHLSPSINSLSSEINRKKAKAQAKINELLASTKLFDTMKTCVGKLQRGLELSHCQKLQNEIATLLAVNNISQKDELNKVKDLLAHHARILQKMESINAEVLSSPITLDRCRSLQTEVATLIRIEDISQHFIVKKVKDLLEHQSHILMEMDRIEMIANSGDITQTQLHELQAEVEVLLTSGDIRHYEIVKKTKDFLAHMARTFEPNQSWKDILSFRYVSLIDRFITQGRTQVADLLIKYVEKTPPANSIIRDLSDYSYNNAAFRRLAVNDQIGLLALVVNSRAPVDALSNIQKIMAMDGFALPEAFKPRFFDASYRGMSSQEIYSFYCQLRGIPMNSTEKIKVEQDKATYSAWVANDAHKGVFSNNLEMNGQDPLNTTLFEE